MNSLDWSSLSFGYIKTEYNVRCHYKDGKWGKLNVSTSENLDVHIAATGLHYGQEAFEGMKAFMGKDGKDKIIQVGGKCKEINKFGKRSFNGRSA